MFKRLTIRNSDVVQHPKKVNCPVLSSGNRILTKPGALPENSTKANAIVKKMDKLAVVICQSDTHEPAAI